MNDFMLIQWMKKGNLPAFTFFKIFLSPGPIRQKANREGFGLLLLNFGINKGYQRENRS